MTTPSSPDPANPPITDEIATGDKVHDHSLRQAAYLTIAVGVAFAILYILSYALLTTTPGPAATDAEIIEFYSSGRQRRLILVGLYVMPFSGIAFLWFIVALRMWIARSARSINMLFSNIQLASGIIFIALLFTASAASAATAASAEFASGPVDPMIARQLPQLSSTILIVFAMRLAAMFVFTTSSIGRSATILPFWFVIMGYAVGLFLLLSATFSPVLALVFPLWILVLCVVLMQRARNIPTDVSVGSLDASTMDEASVSELSPL